MTAVAQLVLPALRWDAHTGYEASRPVLEEGLRLGVGGFILFGGEEDAVRALTKELRQRSTVPLLIGADLERGAGQQFAGATGLPPLAAIASLGDVDALRRAARLTAREARTLGVNWDFAPVCDLDVLPANPIVGSRALGADPARVAALAAEWIDACQAEGVLACAKHFPGHGRTSDDSHMQLPVVQASRQTLQESDLVPFRAAIDAGVASIMTAHVAYPALDPTGVPATLSRDILQWRLRQQMRFEGLIVSDALIMDGVLTGRPEGEVAVRALHAGCDLLLYPAELASVVRACERALREGVLDEERVHQSLRRRLKWAQWASPPNEYRRPAASDVAWGAQLAERVVHVVRGRPLHLAGALDVLVVDDDLGGPTPPPSRAPFVAALTEAGLAASPVSVPGAAGRRSTVLALFGDVRAWKGRAGYAAESRAAVERACAVRPDLVVVQFGHPRLAAEIPAARHVVSAWGGEPVMQRAAARWLVRPR